MRLSFCGTDATTFIFARVYDTFQRICFWINYGGVLWLVSAIRFLTWINFAEEIFGNNIDEKKNCQLAEFLNTPLSTRKVLHSIPVPVKAEIESLITRHRSCVFSELCCPVSLSQGDTIDPATRFMTRRNTP